MGRLVYLHQLDLDARWYFPDAYYNVEKDRYRYPWPNLAYSNMVSIHEDTLKYSGDRRIIIRNWVEQNLQETVIYDVIDKSYFKYFDNKMRNGYEVSNKWSAFYFDNEHSTSIFTIRFCDWVMPITNTHPKDL